MAVNENRQGDPGSRGLFELAAAALSGAALASLAWGMALRRSNKRRDLEQQRQHREPALPDPTWKPGDGPRVRSAAKTLTLSPADLPSRYRFFISAYVPRPIALVSSIDAAGFPNLAPFSYSGIFNHDPGTIVFSCVDKGKDGGDTLKNVKTTREFVVHVMSESFLEAANHTCGNFAPGVDEFVEAGLAKADSKLVRPPRCADAALAMECRVVQIIPLAREDGTVTATMVVGQVLTIHVREDVYDAEQGVVVANKLQPMARLGGNAYSTLGKVFDLARPQV
eukprot:INCI8756.1.p1 GENE.INCI8756.1~~INCI8756.1.p1  ORF type:complete len:281 (+),score=35.61 INCI8756.1:85-927(+)